MSSHNYSDGALFMSDGWSQHAQHNSVRGRSSGRGGRGGGFGRGGFRGGAGSSSKSHPYDYSRGRSSSVDSRRGGPSTRGFQGMCFKCEQYGHRANACPLKNYNASAKQGN